MKRIWLIIPFITLVSFTLGWFSNELISPCEREVEFYCGIYNNSMSCSPIDKSGNATWFFKLPCSENLTKEAICIYSLENQRFLECREIQLILMEKNITNETEN